MEQANKPYSASKFEPILHPGKSKSNFTTDSQRPGLLVTQVNAKLTF